MSGPGKDLPRGIGGPASRAFAQIGLTRLDQFTERSAKELLRLHGVGPKAIRVLEAELAAQGKALRAE